jgi:putative transposase
MWSDGYFVSTIGINESIIRRYIEEQGKEDAGQAKLELG